MFIWVDVVSVILSLNWLWETIFSSYWISSICLSKFDEIFSSTVGRHSTSRQEIPRNFKILQKNLIDTITIKKEEKEKAKSKTNDGIKKDLLLEEKGLEEARTYNETLNNNKTTIE